LKGLIVSPSPHRSSFLSTKFIMLQVIIALVPNIVACTIIFGLRALLVLAVCVVSCVVFEALCRKIMKRDQTVSDLSAVVTGILLGMNLPVTIPLFVAVIGSFIAIVIVKQLFGGIGQNFANPAITARIVLMFSFTSYMSTWVTAFWYKNDTADVVTGATPLAAKWAEYTSNGTAYKMAPYQLKDLFLGTTGGCLGETCALAIIIGGVYLIATRVISASTPVAFIGSLALLTFIYTGSGVETVYQIFAGGLMIGAFFMATDYATTPVTTKGKIIFGIGCGIITFVIRQFGNYPEGVSFSILLMNLLTPYIDRITKTSPLGAKPLVKEAK
jgi:electron transport complex protein RnfD